MSTSKILQYSKHIILLATGLGFFAPFVSSAVKPFLLPLLVLNIAAAVLRMDLSDLKTDFRKASISLWQPLWLMFLSPGIIFGIVSIGLAPDNLHLPLLVFAAAAPMTSTPALALLVRARLAFVAIGLLIGNILMPFTAPLFIGHALPPEAALNVETMMSRLGISIGGAIAIGVTARLLIGVERICAWRNHLDLTSLALVSLICIAVMDQSLALTLAYPGRAAQTLIAVIVVGFFLAFAGYFMFQKLGREARIGAALNSGLPNVGIMLAILGASATIETTLMVATTQTLVCLLTVVFSWSVGKAERIF